MTIHWVYQHSGIGGAFGYTTFAHKLVIELVKKGVEYDRASKVSIQLTPPYFFRLIRFKKNVIFTMFEFEKIPSQWHTILDRADLVIVPCTHNQKIFQDATETKVEVCPGGVDSLLYPYRERTFGEPFTFLFVGDYNLRKGTRQIALAWDMWNERYPELSEKTQLIMKMTSPEEKPELIQKTKNTYFDFRKLPLVESEAKEQDVPTLPALYDYAHCFLFPTMGEGWGLPLCEAMSTGLPSIYTPFGGTLDTASEEYAYPVEYGYQLLKLLNPVGGPVDAVRAADPKIESIVERMYEIYSNYDKALEKGKRAAEVMRQRFGWDKAADKFIDIIKRNYPGVA